MDHVKLSESGWLWMIDPIWTSTFAAWQQSLKCKQTAFKTLMLFAGSIPIGGFLCWGKVWSKCECLSASFVRFFQPWVESIL